MRRFLIVDDHPIVRLAIRELLTKDGHVVAECEDGLDVITVIKEFKPDVLIIDIDLPERNGIEVIQALRKFNKTIPIIAISGKSAEFYGLESFRCGASSFVSKTQSLVDLKMAISLVSSGYTHFPFQFACNESAFQLDEKLRLNTLSMREMQILHFFSEGMDNKEIAERLSISNKTVSTFKFRMMQKLKLNTMKDVVDFSARHNLI
ncbi:response regulator [Pantoea endophytica]|uniref:Response regulator n=1 Tax=Pantoea sp. BJ2 TaxID=3141322 RepID=A0AAU7TVU0_9GAMM